MQGCMKSISIIIILVVCSFYSGTLMQRQSFQFLSHCCCVSSSFGCQEGEPVGTVKL